MLEIWPERTALFHYARAVDQEIRAMASTPSGLGHEARGLLRALELNHDAGYVSIGLDHFALPDDELARAATEGSLHRNFMGYTTRRGSEMVSLGVSAIGEVGGAFVQNDPAEGGYLTRIGERGYATTRGHVLSADDRLRRDVILSIMCNLVLPKAPLEARHGIDFDSYFAAELAELVPLEADGLLELGRDALRITPLGQLFLRNVALPFDRYLRARRAQGESGKGTFSRTL